MNCSLCGVKRLVKNKEVFQCSYCKEWFCDPTCTNKHLGICLQDPDLLHKKRNKERKLVPPK